MEATRADSRRNTPPAVTIAFVAVLAAFWAVSNWGTLERAKAHDFLSFYTGAALARGGESSVLYDPQRQLAVQRECISGATDLMPYIRPNFYAFALAPLAALPFGLAFWVWIAGQAVVLLMCWFWAGRYFGWDAAIYGALYFPAAAGVLNGQDSACLLAIVSAAYLLAVRGRPFLSGALFAMALFKFSLLMLLPLAMLAARRFRMLAGYVSVAAVLGACLLVLGGAGSLPAYRALLKDESLRWLEPARELMVNVYSIPANFGLPANTSLALAAAVIVATVVVVRKAPLWLWLSATLVGSVLVNPHAYVYDATVLLLPLWLILFRSEDRALRILAAVITVPLPFFALLAGPPWSSLPAVLLLSLLLTLLRVRPA